MDNRGTCHFMMAGPIYASAKSVVSTATKIILPLKNIPPKMDQIARKKKNNTEFTLASRKLQRISQALAPIANTPLSN